MAGKHFYLLEAIDFNNRHDKGHPFYSWYDCVKSFVVIAGNELEARQFASLNHNQEGKDAWLDKKYTTCKIITTNNQSGVVCRDHRGA